MIKADETVLKTDRRGRVQTPAGRREQLLDEFERSGLSGVKFAELTGVKYQTLATWLKKRRKARGQGACRAGGSKSFGLLEAVVEANRSDGLALILELPGGAKMQIQDVHQAALAGTLLRTLGKSC